MRIKRATLRRNDGRIEMFLPSQCKGRNTECTYGLEDHILVIAGHEIYEHPDFENVQEFEDWCSTFFGDSKAWWENVSIEDRYGICEGCQERVESNKCAKCGKYLMCQGAKEYHRIDTEQTINWIFENVLKFEYAEGGFDLQGLIDAYKAWRGNE